VDAVRFIPRNRNLDTMAVADQVRRHTPLPIRLLEQMD